MTTYWPDGTRKSNDTAFSGACLEDREPAKLRATPGRKPRGQLLDRAGNLTVSLKPNRSTLDIFPSDVARTTRIMRGTI